MRKRILKPLIVYTAASIGFAFLPAAFAFITPTEAPGISKGISELTSIESGELTNSPILLDMAKSISKTRLTPQFFVIGDAYIQQNSLDMRALVMYQAGLIKTPIRLNFSGNEVKDGVTLSFPTMFTERPIVVDRPPETADNDSLLSLSLPQSPFSINPSGLPMREVRTFRFWTYVDKKIFTNSNIDSLSRESKVFPGSFVVCSPKSVKAIKGNLFTIDKGIVLINDQESNFVFQTNYGQIETNPGDIAVIDTKSADKLKLTVLKTKSPNGICVSIRNDSGNSNVYVRAGEKHIFNPIMKNGSIDKGSKEVIVLKTYIENEPLFKPNSAVFVSNECASSLEQLKSTLLK